MKLFHRLFNYMQEKLHELRKQVDACIQAVDAAKYKPDAECLVGSEKCGRELSLAFTKLQEAKMWLGKCLEAVGSELPAEFADKAE